MSTPPISQLCKNCSQVLDIDLLLDHNNLENKTLYRFEDTWPELPGLAASGDSGCGLCKLIRDTFVSQSPSTEYKGPVSGLVERHATWSHEKPRKILDYSVRIYSGSEGDVDWYTVTRFVEWSKVTGYAQFLPCSDDDDMPFPLPPPAEIMSAQTVDFLKRSIDQCESTCHPWQPSGSIPSRLLDISDYKTRERIQLVQTEKLPRVKYAALSYCWGNADDAAYQPKTNSANLSERLNGFGIDTMSPVVRDAIITCHALGMRYLWVDALCILQGKADVADWDIESQKMADIFRNAYITICPSSSNSCREGFLGQRLVHPGIRVKTPITSNAIFQNQSREYSILPYFKYDNNTPSFIHSHEFINSKWYSRAWVWQEINLSARLVIFTPTFVFYRCPKTLLCENGTRKETTIILEGLGQYHRKRYQDAQPFAFFRTCVEDISSKDISFESDRLAAVAGVAKQVSQATGSQYAAGLWVKDIYKDLIFKRNLRSRNNRDKGGLEKYIESLRTRHSEVGPTWSWPGHGAGVCWDSIFSSVDHETLQLNYADWRYEYKHLDISTDKVGDNLFGQVSRGSLAVTTKMASLTEIAALHDGDDDELIRDMLITPESTSKVACGIIWNWDVDNAETSSHLADKILVMAISSCLYGHSGSGNMYGLMVYPAEKEGEYYRVGSFEAQSAADDDADGNTGVLVAEEWKERSIVII
ncbi:hypothetical protein BFJ63_vAg11073 [Fusarium oxysporum f. sp. narcissi]|uniref:Heterokaryon incompatibility domain-containing protein n=2 Tax=Fusarium oxysporum TaxID=5507 RepID=A0A4Q2VJ94_FUSOX|nr:hypothetical protein BFJ65_g16367 [Fusarium oxysporum f. sp. cepae]RKK33756.1 hypothetical protein BFJ67_g14109 [Fusarium oxysporum f. sp. cepae]RKK35309.1 hypothetical protein BFJ66_g14033 [Fusarium oxysporum f. sp. cepae]RYC86047.1 hypothetical protein BFJ63_vAg11073 [Fusarium oxysporum f. sp. narcissi]